MPAKIQTFNTLTIKQKGNTQIAEILQKLNDEESNPKDVKKMRLNMVKRVENSIFFRFLTPNEEALIEMKQQGDFAEFQLYIDFYQHIASIIKQNSYRDALNNAISLFFQTLQERLPNFQVVYTFSSIIEHQLNYYFEIEPDKNEQLKNDFIKMQSNKNFIQSQNDIPKIKFRPNMISCNCCVLNTADKKNIVAFYDVKYNEADILTDGIIQSLFFEAKNE